VMTAAGSMAQSQGRTLFYTTSAPVTMDLNIRSHTTQNAFVTWNTDVDSFSFIRYRAVGDEDWMETALEPTHRSAHNHEMTNLVPDITYEVEIHNTQVTDPAFTFDHVPGWSSWIEIQKETLTLTAKSFVDPNAPGNAIDGSTTTGWYTGTGNAPQWLRVDMGSPMEPRILDYYFTADVTFDVYVTDSTLDTVADWGTPVAHDVYPTSTQRQLVLIPKVARYLIINITNGWHIGANEIAILTPSPTRVDDFSVADQDTGNALWTNDATVAVTSFVADAAGGVAGWMITESAVEPLPEDEGWLAEAPVACTITGGEGTVTLYAWVKDASGRVGGKSTSILFSTAAPTVSNVAVTAGEPGSGTATVTWNTDVPAFPSVRFGAVSLLGATPNTVLGTAVGTAHGVQLTGIADATNYKLIVVSNDKAEPAIYWPLPWPIEGDANMDCRVNILDLIFIRNKLNQPAGTGDNWKADVNQDTRINILDLIFVRNKLNTQCP